MKILMYGWEFPPHISGGLGVACHAIVTELAKLGVNIALVLPQVVEGTSSPSPLVSIFGCDFGQSVDSLSVDENFKKSFNPLLLNPYLSSCQSGSGLQGLQVSKRSMLSNQWVSEKLSLSELSAHYAGNLLGTVFRYAMMAGRFASALPHDLIHCHDWLTILAGIEAKRLSGKPLIFHVHALETDRSGEHVYQDIYQIEKYGLEKADRVIAVSQYTKDQMVQHYHVDPAKVTVVHNGIYPYDLARLNAPQTDKPKMVLFIGRVTHQKGPYFFIEIAKKILAKRQDIQFVMAGQGDQLKEMINRVAEAHIGQYVHFTGFLNQEKVDRIYQLADVYVMPSVSEPFGLTCLEAISRGVPAVISKQSGVSETLPHSLKADFWDVDAMVDKVLALLNRPRLRKVLLMNAEKNLPKISWVKTARKVKGVYQELVGVLP